MPRLDESALRKGKRAVLREDGAPRFGGGSGIAFVFARTDTAVWHDLVFPNARALLFLRGRVRFFRRDGSVGDSAPTPSVLIGFSDYDSERLREASDTGAIKGYYVRTLK